MDKPQRNEPEGSKAIKIYESDYAALAEIAAANERTFIAELRRAIRAHAAREKKARR